MSQPPAGLSDRTAPWRIALALPIASFVALAALGAASEDAGRPPSRVPEGIILSKDLSGGMTVYSPSFAKNGKVKGVAFASISKWSDRQREAFLNVVVRGVPREALASIDLEMDGERRHLPLTGEATTIRQVSACKSISRVTFGNQEALIRAIAAARVVTLSFGDVGGQRRYRLHDLELDRFRRMVDLLDMDPLPTEGPGPPETAGSEGTPVAGVHGVTNPTIIPGSKVPPRYPEEARRRGHGARVVLQAIIRKDGSVGDLEPIDSTGECSFEKAAIEAVSRWRYEPATRHGKAIDVYFTVVVDFTLESRGSAP